MARTLPANTDTATQAAITTPIYLVRINLSTGDVRHSSRGDVTYNGYSWSGTGIRVENLTPTKGGGMSGAISIPNTDLAWSAIVLNNDIRGRDIDISMVYSETPSVGDAVMVFSGVMDSVPVIDTRVVINIVSEGIGTAFSPRLFCAPPLCNHMPAAGTIIEWSGERYVLEGQT